MKIKKGDKVKVISGKYKGVDTVVERVYLEENKVLLEGVNIVTRHVKDRGKIKGGLIKVNRPIDASNVMLVDPKDGKVTKIGYKLVDGKKYRFAKNSGELIDKK